MKKISTLILLSFGLLHCSAQSKLAGKTYVAEVGASCKDGVGMFYTYRVLAFRKKSVMLSYRVVAYMEEEKKKEGYEHLYDHLAKSYKWKRNKDTIIIEGCKELSVLLIKDSKILAQDKEWNKSIIFATENNPSSQ